MIALTGGSAFQRVRPYCCFCGDPLSGITAVCLAGLLVATLIWPLFDYLAARFAGRLNIFPFRNAGDSLGSASPSERCKIKKIFLGLQMPHVPEHYLQKVGALFMALPTANMGDAAIGIARWVRSSSGRA